MVRKKRVRRTQEPNFPWCGEALKFVRKERGLSRRGLSVLCGEAGLDVTDRTILNWENEFTYPSQEKAEAIAHVLECNVREFDATIGTRRTVKKRAKQRLRAYKRRVARLEAQHKKLRKLMWEHAPEEEKRKRRSKKRGTRP